MAWLPTADPCESRQLLASEKLMSDQTVYHQHTAVWIW